MERGRAGGSAGRPGASGTGADGVFRAAGDMGEGGGEGVVARPAPEGLSGAPEVPPLTYADYAAFARQGDAQILACCTVETFHASGPGGQGVNTADSAVRMRHVPTGIVVAARSERTQLLNRRACLAKLRAELERRSRPPKKRKKTHVPHRAKEHRLQAKHQISAKKSLRGKVSAEE